MNTPDREIAGRRRPPGDGGSRTQRRVLRTKAAIEEAFVALVIEHGYEKVSVEDIVARADLAKATFYAHYDNKEALLLEAFSRLIEELAERIAYREGPWTVVRRGALEAAYEHAAEMPDLYRVCLGDARTRATYMATVARFAEQNFHARLAALGREPRMPVHVMAVVFAGAHVALLESWLAGDITGSAGEVASMLLDLLIAGSAWAHNISLADLGYIPLPVAASNPTEAGEV